MAKYSQQENRLISVVQDHAHYEIPDVFFQTIAALSSSPDMQRILTSFRQDSIAKLRQVDNQSRETVRSYKMSAKQPQLSEFLDPQQEITDLITSLEQEFSASPDLPQDEMYKKFWQTFKPFITLCSISLATILHGEEERAIEALHRLELFVNIIANFEKENLNLSEKAVGKVLFCLSLFLRGGEGVKEGQPVQVSGLLEQIVRTAERQSSPVVKAEASIFTK